MLRRLHSIPGIVAALIVCFMAVTGSLLALEPTIEHLRAGAAASPQLTVAQLADAVATSVPGVERVARSASGMVIAYGGDHTATSIDAATGAASGAYQPSAFFSFMTELHRSLFLGDTGHAVAGIAALAMLVLSLSGGMMLVARLGGWRKLFAAARGTLRQRLHVGVGRIVLLALLLSAAIGLYLSLVSFGFVSDGANGFMAFPANVDGGKPAAIASLGALQALPVSDLRELVFPVAGDPTDVFTLTTAAGQGFVDQASGAMLSFVPNSLGQTIYEAFYTLHTGQGVWWLGLLLGIAALGAPVMAVSGILIWWRRRASQPTLAHNAKPATADTVILVGSEGNSTWGFAEELHDRLIAAGHVVHTAPMNGLASAYPAARRLFVLTATYGDGSAPASANRFLARLGKLRTTALDFAVLGFGDRSFAHYCRFAEDVEAALLARGLTPLQALGTIDRQSAQAFAAWGAATGARIGTPLDLVHIPTPPRTTALILESRVDYGWEVQAPTAVLRFVMPNDPTRGLLSRMLFGSKRLPRFETGDLVGIVPPGSSIPRYYSLASDSHDGVLEICVRKQQSGVCSEFLHGLEPGCTIDAFVRSNPAFRPASGKAPVIMIGAGTGIAPLAGFIRKNRQHRPIHLFFGGRDPQSDFLYRDELDACLDDARVTEVNTAFSRIVGGAYVQDKVRAEAEAVRALIARGAQVMVCGGRDMAQGVMESIDDIVAPLGLSVAGLKTKGRYLEDVY